MSTTTTGFDQAHATKPGTMIERIYFVIPGNYGQPVDGEEYDTQAAALAALIKHDQADAERYAAHYRGVARVSPPRLVIDTRWRMTYRGGVSDVVAERTTYDGPGDAQAHLQRLVRYGQALAVQAAGVQHGAQVSLYAHQDQQ